MPYGTIQHLGTNPDTLIEQLHFSLNEIIARAHRLKRSKELDQIITKMKELYFKVNMAKLTNDKTILSITGLQGVGKTKILRDLYDLDDTLLPSDGGRGEVLPVLFTETPSTSSPAYFVRRAERHKDNQLYELKDFQISLEELNIIAAGADKQNDNLWLEVRLPQRYFNTEMSLALLPGFENDKSQFSQKYLETFLSLSTSVLLVFNHKKLAQKSQQVLLERVASDYRESAPIFALSFAEELNAQQRSDLKNEISKKFTISDNELDRIVYTGTCDDLKNYPDNIINAIYKYATTNVGGYVMQMHMLTSLTAELSNVISLLEAEINSIRNGLLIKQISSENNNDTLGLLEIREAFREYRTKVAKNIRNIVNKSLAQHVENCTEKMNDELENESHDLWDEFLSAFKKNNKFVDRRNFERQIKRIWNGDNEVESERRLIDSLDSFVRSETRAIAAPKQKITIQEPVTNPLLTPIVQTKESMLEDDSNHIIESTLANIDNYISSDDLSISLTKNDLKILPIVAVGIAQEMVAASLILDIEKFDLLDANTKQEIINKSNTLVSEFKDLAINASTVIKGAAIFFGIDALDGTFNTFGALTGILTSLGVSSAVAAPLGVVIIGAIGSALAIHKGSERIEKYKFERSGISREIFNSFATIQEDSIIATINNILDKMEEKLVDTYHLRRGTDKNFGLLDELDNRLNRMHILCGEVQEMAFRNESYLFTLS